MQDTVASRLSDLELAAFVTACAGERLDQDETTSLTRAMVAVGQRLNWGDGPVLDKHCVGGLPGNRTTPIVVAIIAALGYRIPKTSSRAITSPAGTADAMETMAPVALDLPAMRRVVEREGGCIVWGGNVRLSPADDILIRVERPLDFDSDGQLVASVLSKKIAAGSTHVLIDMPVGPTAKVRSDASADDLSARLRSTAAMLGLHLAIHRSDGTQPVGAGIGPALEARDVLKVLRNDAGCTGRPAPAFGRLGGRIGRYGNRQCQRYRHGTRLGSTALRASSGEVHGHLRGAGRVPRTATGAVHGRGHRHHERAYYRDRQPPPSAHCQAGRRARVVGRRTRNVLRIGDVVARGQVLFTMHAQSRGEAAYALEHAAGNMPFDIAREAA